MTLRASDHDRELLATELRTHFAAGRLTDEELSERLGSAYAARTADELAAVRADLPDPRPVPARTSTRELARRRVYQDAGRVALVNVMCVAIWLASGANGDFWPVWVMIVSAFRLAQDGWRLLGPAPEAARRPRRRVRR